MGVRPNFEDPVRMTGGEMIVAGVSEDDPLPVDIQVFVEQRDRVVGGSVDQPSSMWRATLSSDGFKDGRALAFGVEIRTRPFGATTWSQEVRIEADAR
jgi:hypothetical protein